MESWFTWRAVPTSFFFLSWSFSYHPLMHMRFSLHASFPSPNPDHRPLRLLKFGQLSGFLFFPTNVLILAIPEWSFKSVLPLFGHNCARCAHMHSDDRRERCFRCFRTVICATPDQGSKLKECRGNMCQDNDTRRWAAPLLSVQGGT